MTSQLDALSFTHSQRSATLESSRLGADRPPGYSNVPPFSLGNIMQRVRDFLKVCRGKPTRVLPLHTDHPRLVSKSENQMRWGPVFRQNLAFEDPIGVRTTSVNIC